MPYVTSWERRGLERGQEIGEEKGQKKMVLQLLKWKFGALETEVAAKIEQLPVSRLNKLAKALLKFTKPADLTRWLDRNAV